MPENAKRFEQSEIRTLTIKDYDCIVELWKRARLPFKPFGRDSREMIEIQMQAFPEFFIGTYMGERLVGIVICSYDGRMKGWINRLAVDPEYRNRGIAHQLINAAEKNLKKRGATIFGALIETSNKESLSLFEKMGYTAHQDIVYVTKRKSEDA